MQEVIITIIVFASIFGVVYVYFSSRNKERLALIEKGADASLFNTGKESATLKKFSIKFGMFLVGIGIGIFLGAILEELVGFADEGPMYAGSIMLFGGLGLVSGYFIARKVKDE